MQKTQIAVGESLVEEKIKIKKPLTFEKTFKECMEGHYKKEKLSWKYDDREVKKYLKHWLKHWFKRQESSIKKQTI